MNAKGILQQWLCYLGGTLLRLTVQSGTAFTLRGSQASIQPARAGPGSAVVVTAGVPVVLVMGGVSTVRLSGEFSVRLGTA